jgi:hypothetical protein
MIAHDQRWSLPRGNTLVPSRWQATPPWLIRDHIPRSKSRIAMGEIEPPTFRFPAGFTGPNRSSPDRLTRLYGPLAPRGIRVLPHVIQSPC